jgi:hypothetical protein
MPLPEELPQYWYRPADKEDDDSKRHRAGLLLAETSDIEQRQNTWHQLNLWYSTAYYNRELVGFRWGAESGDEEFWPADLRTENLIRQGGNAFKAKASMSPLKPTLVPTGLSYEVEEAVRQADNFGFAAWQQANSEDAAVLMFDDAYTSGIGCVRTVFDSKKKTLHDEAVFFDNVIIDNRECANRATPLTYRIRQVVPRASVERLYKMKLRPEQEKRPYVKYRQVGRDYVVLIEAWRIGERHCVACEGELLVDEAWPHDWVPLVFFHWNDRTSGWFVPGGVEEGIPFQIRQNELNDDIKAAQDLGCRMRMLLHASTQIHPEQWDSEQGRFLMYSGQKPEPFAWDTRLLELYQERRENKASYFSSMGLSEMFANADMPDQVRMDSSAGIREAWKMEDARHLRLWTKFEEARLEIAKNHFRVLAVSSGSDSYKANFKPKMDAAGEEIPWEAIKTLEDNQYSWTMAATPLSMMQPAARRELVRDFASRGQLQMGSDEARRIEGNPNLERIDANEMASVDDIYRHLKLMERGQYEAPTELTNLSAGIPLVIANYHRLRRYKDVRKTVLDNHIKWITRATSIQAGMTQQQQPPADMSAFQPTQGVAGTSAAKAPPPPQVIQQWAPPGGQVS